MLQQAVRSIVRQTSGRVMQLVCVALFLPLATRATSYADTTYPVGHETPLHVTGPSAAAEVRGEGVDQAGRGMLPLAGKMAFMAISSGRTGSRAMPVAEDDGPSPAHAADTVGRKPDWNGIWRDTGTFFGTQIVAAGILYSAPQSVSGWSSEEKKNTFKKYSQNVFDPVFDKDQFYINYVLHPYWGATYYIRGRERGLDRFSAFAYSALISAMYEFGVECFFEKPSIQDLIVTPVAGSLLGAFVFEPWRESIRRKQDLRWYDHAVLVVTDPLGVLSLGIEKVFGIRSTVRVNYSNPALQRLASGPGFTSKGSRIWAEVLFSMD